MTLRKLSNRLALVENIVGNKLRDDISMAEGRRLRKKTFKVRNYNKVSYFQKNE